MNIASPEFSQLHSDFQLLCHAKDVSNDVDLTPYMPALEQRESAVISPDYPYRILQQTPAFSKMFGFMNQGLGLVSLRVVFGPDTDEKKLHTTIASIVQSGEQADYFTFYKRNGDDVRFLLRGFFIKFNGRDACQLNINESELAAGNDLPSASKLELRFGASHSKPSCPTTFTFARDETLQFRNSASPAIPDTSKVDQAVLIHIKAIRKAAASKGTAKGC